MAQAGAPTTVYQRLLDPADEDFPTAVGSAEGGVQRRWDAAPDLERFLGSFYRYYEVGGYKGIVALHLSHLTALAFTIGFSFVLLFAIDWQALLSCDSEESCRAISICYESPFSDMGFWRLTVFLFFLLFVAYWVCHAAAAFHSIRDAAEMSSYYQEGLGIFSDEILSTMSWSEVVCRLIRQQKAAPFCIVQERLTALEVANIIMRQDNFMVALTNQDAFTSRLPAWIPHRLVYTRAVLWNLRTMTFNFMFDARSRVRHDFLNCPENLAQRFRWMGVLNLVLVVPVLMFVTIYFFMRHAEEFRSHRSSPFQRQWTDYAQWTFREFGELPHHFALRMSRARTSAEAFASSARPASPMVSALLRCIKFIAGSILAALLLLAFYDEAPLLFVKIQDKNLLWYLALFGFVFAIADTSEDEAPRAQYPQGTVGGGNTSQPTLARGTAGPRGPASSARPMRLQGSPLHMYISLMQLVRCTHHLPPSWRPPCDSLAALTKGGGGRSASQRAVLTQHFAKVRSEFLRSFFVHRIQVLVEELLGVVLAPLLLIVYFPKAAPDIVNTIRQTRHASPNLGDWCVFGCLDPCENGSEFYGGGTLRLAPDALSEAVADGRSSSSLAAFDQAPAAASDGSFMGWGNSAVFDRDVERHDHRPGQGGRTLGVVSNGGKLEKSVVSFIQAHRQSWSGQDEEDDDNVSYGTPSGSFVRSFYNEMFGRGHHRASSSSSWTSKGASEVPLATRGLEMAEAVLDMATSAVAVGTMGSGPSSFARQESSTSSARTLGPEKLRVDGGASSSSIPLLEAHQSGREHTSEQSAGQIQELNEWHAEGPPSPGDLANGSREMSTAAGTDASQHMVPSMGMEDDDACLQGQLEARTATIRGSPEVIDMAASSREVVCSWVGCSETATKLMFELEDFRRRELEKGARGRRSSKGGGAASPSDLYALLPEDLLHCSAQCDQYGQEAEEEGCGAHFFWLEVLYDLHSGRRKKD
eukprot:TRINITY_DN12355_c1_g1_i1.p1 TRINITY_DN12355_c1_g1~~TRINITY_DN12355_c1_g1_i1.p1  ORF type:complete len:982 (-),score=182.12 TRINITY_DN12355_c1_g1_i1:152-3097(-)